MPSLRRCRTVRTEHAYGLGKRSPHPATRLGQKRHWMGLVTGVVNAAGYNIGPGLKPGTAVAEKMRGFRERAGLGMLMHHGVKKGLLG
jgi:hypothetical protein